MPKLIHRNLLAMPRGDSRVFLSWRHYSSDGVNPEFVIERREPGGAWRALTRVTGRNTMVDQPRNPGNYEYRIQHARVPSEAVLVDNAAEATNVALRIPLPVPAAQCVGPIITGPLLNNVASCYVLRFLHKDSVWFRAFGPAGGHLWDIDSGLPAQGDWGANHVPFLIWDIDGDGRMEFITHFGGGAWKDDLKGAHYDRARDGEKFLVVDGETGAPKYTAPWPAMSPRVMMTVGYLSGFNFTPQVVVQDDSYGDIVLTAVDGATGQILWQTEQARPGGHNLDIADIDGDGVQEVIAGGVCRNGDGTVRWEAETFGHTDMSKPVDMIMDRPGMEIAYLVESGNPGVYLVDSQGQTVWKEPFAHAHFGWIARHTPDGETRQLHAAEDRRQKTNEEHHPIFLPDGSHWTNLTNELSRDLMPVQWDDGAQTVFVHRRDKQIVRLGQDLSLTPLEGGELPQPARFNRNLLTVDVLGDHRENIVTIDEASNELIVLANPTEISYCSVSPMESFQYLHDRSQIGSGYYLYLAP
ncbi:MAG: hypothetical protein ACOC2L_03240 [Candidatus Sumerlaeota bacterium]